MDDDLMDQVLSKKEAESEAIEQNFTRAFLNINNDTSD